MLDSTVSNYFPYNKNLLLWVTEISETGKTYYIVSDTLRREYYLYNNKNKMLIESKSPIELSKRIK